MAKGLSAALMVVLLLLPVLMVSQPFSPARAQTGTGEYEQEYTNSLRAGYYNSTAITIQSPSIIGYATKSNVSIYTAFMDQQELDGFTQPSAIANSIFYQAGDGLYDAVLEGPGTYYLVEYAYAGAANVTALYVVNPNVNLRNSTTSVGELVTIDPGEVFALPLHVETLGSSSQVDIVGASTRVVQYALLDKSTGEMVFRSPDVTITNFTVTPTVSVGYNVTLKPGLYVMGITDESSDPAYVYFSYTITPTNVNPYLFAFGPPSPTGIAAYGIYNDSGTVVPYEVESTAIVGFAQVSELQATDNESGSHQCSLQENTVLEVNDTDGSSFTYWPQNVLAFDTGAATVTYRDNVLNITGDGAQLTNQSITGAGTTSLDDNVGVIQSYYGNNGSDYTSVYALPQSWVLYTNETVEQGVGVLISMGVRALDGPAPKEITWYDRITIHDPNVAAAALVVDGMSYTPAGASSINGMFYDAELVFGGAAGGQAATYKLDANLALFYQGHTLVPFPSLYTFGDDSAEAAYNIIVSYGNGSAIAQSGTPNYGILTNDFNASLASLVASATPHHSSILALLAYAGAGVLVVVIVAVVLVAARRRPEPAVPQEKGEQQPAPGFCGNCGAPVEPDAAFCANCGSRQVPESPAAGS